MQRRNIELQVITLPTTAGLPCQTLVINLLRRAKPEDLEPLALPPNLDLTQGVLIFGAAPIWLYGCLIALCRSAPWIATYHVRRHGGIVVASRIAAHPVGAIIPIEHAPTQHPAILIGGPPSSGKSVLSYSLNRALIQHIPHLKTHLFRANWDGEGNHTYESLNTTRSEQLRRQNNPKLQHQPDAPEKIARFFQGRGEEVPNLRSMMDLTLVDIGGRTDRDRLPVVTACTHSIIISSDPEKIGDWRDLCDPYLQPLAIIHSVQASRVEVVRSDPYLEVIAGPWERGQDCQVPEVLRDRVLSVLS
ncbi:CRISPR-associated protein Csx3 [Spirulina major]|uniref:CRISPR-associated protein Csx3 n=1 Tax=Spirulina major TaxID=270636 RepID=UPI0009345407|nr:CRISPR-associated protein Csx3 [Spirulina major]